MTKVFYILLGLMFSANLIGLLSSVLTLIVALCGRNGCAEICRMISYFLFLVMYPILTIVTITFLLGEKNGRECWEFGYMPESYFAQHQGTALMAMIISSFCMIPVWIGLVYCTNYFIKARIRDEARHAALLRNE